MEYNKLASQDSITKTIAALNKNNIVAEFFQTGEEAKNKVIELIPEGSEVMTMSSITLEALGIPKIFNESGKYNSIRIKLTSLNRETQGKEMNKLGSAPDYSICSVHAITEGGQLLIASRSGSQIPGIVYGSQKVILVVGAQKIVPSLDAGFKRIYDYVLPLESVRVQKVYGLPHSAVNKLLVINHESIPDRIHLLLVNEVLGF